MLSVHTVGAIRACVVKMGSFHYTVEESVSTETDLLRNKSYKTSAFNRRIISMGIFIATAANLTMCRVKVGEDIVAEFDFPEGTAPAGRNVLRECDILVAANSQIQVLVTNSVATNSIFEMDLVA